MDVEDRWPGARSSRRRSLLMCEPTYFDVRYSINPWMDPSRPTSTMTGLSQWKNLHDTLVELGHEVHLVQPEPDLPDMVFAANGATVIDGKVLVANFRHEQRKAESAIYQQWFRRNGWNRCATARCINEGEGDFLFTGARILAATGFRSEPAAHAELADYFGRPVLGLGLVDPRFYHLDTALAVLGAEQIMYFPAAFDIPSQRLLAEHYPEAILATERDAEVFGLNAFCDGQHVLLPERATGLAQQLRSRGYQPIPLDLTELLKAGGSVKCCILELRG